MPLTHATTTTELILMNPGCAPVLSKYRIDFETHGNLTITQACKALGLDVETVISDLEQVLESNEMHSMIDAPAYMPPRALVQHIAERYHLPLRDVLPHVTTLAATVARADGEEDPSLVELSQAVAKLSAFLLEHIDEEERTVFPMIMAGQGDPTLVKAAARGLFTEYEQVSAQLRDIRALAKDFEVPGWADEEHQALLLELEALEHDIHEHVLLENNALVPALNALMK